MVALGRERFLRDVLGMSIPQEGILGGVWVGSKLETILYDTRQHKSVGTHGGGNEETNAL